MIRSALFSLTLIATVIVTAQDEDTYAGFSATDGNVIYETVINASDLTAAQIITDLEATLKNMDEVSEIVVDGEVLTYTITGRTIDAHAHGLSNQNMKSEYLQPYRATVSVQAKDERYKVVVTEIVFDKKDAKKKDEPVKVEDLMIDEGKMKRLGVADKYAMDALALDIISINTIAVAEDDDSDDW